MEGYFTCRCDDGTVRDCAERGTMTRSSAREGLGELDLHGKVSCNKRKHAECYHTPFSVSWFTKVRFEKSQPQA